MHVVSCSGTGPPPHPNFRESERAIRRSRKESSHEALQVGGGVENQKPALELSPPAIGDLPEVRQGGRSSLLESVRRFFDEVLTTNTAVGIGSYLFVIECQAV